MPVSSDYIDYICEQLAPLGHIVCKRMFGGYSLNKDGPSFALVLDDTLYFKVDDSNRGDYESAGSQPFTYEKKGKIVIISSWEVPAQVIEDADELTFWAQRAVVVAHRKQARKK